MPGGSADQECGLRVLKIFAREERSGCSRLLTLGGNILTKLVPLAWVDRHGTNLTPRPRPTQTQLNPALAIAADPTAPVGPASLWVTAPHLLRVCVGATAAAAAAPQRTLLRGKRERNRGRERQEERTTRRQAMDGDEQLTRLLRGPSAIDKGESREREKEEEREPGGY